MRRRRSPEELLRARTIDWQHAGQTGYTKYRTACAACGEIAHCRGKRADSLRCWNCWKTGRKPHVTVEVPA